MLQFIRKSDFYTAPASTRYHLAEDGGLLKHSLHVYECLAEKAKSGIWKEKIGQIPQETFIIVALLHDVCKVYMYEKDYKNQKTYEASAVNNANPREVKHDAKGDFVWETVPTYVVNNKYPLGHGSKSVIYNIYVNSNTFINNYTNSEKIKNRANGKR